MRSWDFHEQHLGSSKIGTKAGSARSTDRSVSSHEHFDYQCWDEDHELRGCEYARPVIENICQRTSHMLGVGVEVFHLR
jgi:hypothetical protein